MSFEQAVVNLEQANAKLQEEVVRFRDAAMGLNSIYPSVTDGRQAVADGKYFSVPGGGAYMRLYRRQGSSAELIAEFPDRAELNSVIAQLGPLLGRGVVGGSGDLMSQGAYGIGGTTPPEIPGYNSVPPGGIYADGSLSTPGQPAARRFAIASFARSPASAAIKAFALDSNFTEPREFTRVINNNIVMPWRENYHQGSILGPVSQFEGVPTGAVIERGSNANGEYVKFADGTFFAWRNVIITVDTSSSLSVNSERYDLPLIPLSGAATTAGVQGAFHQADSPNLYTTSMQAISSARTTNSWSYYSQFPRAKFTASSGGANRLELTLTARGRYH